ncbi:NAAT family transporter [Chlorobaculum sp. 24CR]|uniref:MarC family protein n=1 Tax=Chlorobaculum sp. 24CR TaxID=2508878 RepID=UPI00100AAD1B|nr:MarC family protein [Chlorobaculum sp. 24CR]RXK87578.1 NAAT family transporter [Chlorobaculum sp. 24CR]
MENLWVHALTVFMGLFAIMNPIANVPIFLSLTEGDDEKTTAMVASRALLLAFLIVSVFSVAGKLIFDLFGITLPAFQITGGLLVFLIGFHMLQGDQSSVQHPSEKDKKKSLEAALSVTISPLAMPILAGPGTIATAMNFSTGENFMDMAVTIAMFGVLCIITYVLFVSGGKFVTYIGPSALGVITRMMGLILAVIGTQMVITGMHGAFGLKAG